MRIVSNQPSTNGGYIHRLDTATPVRPKKEEPIAPTIDAEKMLMEWFNGTENSNLERLADDLGVSFESLIALKCCWSPVHNVFGFPMRNGAGRCVGFRLRAENGRKWSVRGGHEGVFQPYSMPQHTAFCAEGPTDTAALLSIGKYAIGRPSCMGGAAILSATIARLRIRQAVIIADNDEDHLKPDGNRWNPGLDGAQKLANDIGVPCCVLVLPVKDCREAVKLGMTGTMLDLLVNSQVWKQPRKQEALNITNREHNFNSKNLVEQYTSKTRCQA